MGLALLHLLGLLNGELLLCLFLQDYFGVCSEVVIKDNVVVVYEVLEEMLDNGFPLATESNILKELIKPPTILRTVVNTITGMRQRGVGKVERSYDDVSAKVSGCSVVGGIGIQFTTD